MLPVFGSNLYNSLPLCLRMYEGSFEGFKVLLDLDLSTIPGCPILPGYISHNLDLKGNMSNSLIDWNRNCKNSNWNGTNVSKVPNDNNSANDFIINPTIV